MITGPLTVSLRAEGDRRSLVYTIGVTCTDKSGNASTASMTVGVPKEKEKDDDKDDRDKDDKKQKDERKKK